MSVWKNRELTGAKSADDDGSLEFITINIDGMPQFLGREDCFVGIFISEMRFNLTCSFSNVLKPICEIDEVYSFISK